MRPSGLPSASISGAPVAGGSASSRTTPRSRRGVRPPRLSIRATSSWPTKQPFVKLTVSATMPDSAGMSPSVSSRPAAGTPDSIRTASSASAPQGAVPGGGATCPATRSQPGRLPQRTGAATTGARRSSLPAGASPGASAAGESAAPRGSAGAAGPRTASMERRCSSRSTSTRSMKRSRRASAASPAPAARSQTNRSGPARLTRRRLCSLPSGCSSSDDVTSPGACAATSWLS